uniref:SCP domain-containing protein n=1 Tax=Oryza brachyantha TaxID=4533 RepID=J3N1I3_ORYBR
MGNGETRNLACPYSTYPGKGRRDGVWTGNRGVTKASPASGSTKAQEGTARLGVKEGVKPEVCGLGLSQRGLTLDRGLTLSLRGVTFDSGLGLLQRGPFSSKYARAWSAADAVASWVGEKKNYHYSTNTCDAGKVCGHYTQVVWRKSVRIGGARVVCAANRGVSITSNYDPPGNFNGQWPFLTLDVRCGEVVAITLKCM